MLNVVLFALALLSGAPLELCSAQQQQQDGSVRVDNDGELLFSNGNLSVTLRALVAQLSTLTAGQSAIQASQFAMQAGLSAVVAGQTALVNEVCRIQGRTSIFQSVPTQGA
jgi:hypothetical protein